MFADSSLSFLKNSCRLQSLGYFIFSCAKLGLPPWLSGKESAFNAGDAGLIPRSERFTGEGNGNPLQYSCLGNPMDRAASWATVCGVAMSRTRLSNQNNAKLSSDQETIQGNPNDSMRKTGNVPKTSCLFRSFQCEDNTLSWGYHGNKRGLPQELFCATRSKAVQHIPWNLA